MEDHMKSLKIFTRIFLFSFLVSCRSLAECPTELHSLDGGSVTFGAEACSPDGTRRAREIAPQNQGKIGTFDKAGKLLREIPLEEIDNPLKGLAWSPDSKYLAVIYHHGPGGYIAVLDVTSGQIVERITIAKWFHYLKFSLDGRSLTVKDASGHAETQLIGVQPK